MYEKLTTIHCLSRWRVLLRYIHTD